MDRLERQSVEIKDKKKTIEERKLRWKGKANAKNRQGWLGTGWLEDKVKTETGARLETK